MYPGGSEASSPGEKTAILKQGVMQGETRRKAAFLPGVRQHQPHGAQWGEGITICQRQLPADKTGMHYLEPALFQCSDAQGTGGERVIVPSIPPRAVSAGPAPAQLGTVWASEKKLPNF